MVDVKAALDIACSGFPEMKEQVDKNFTGKSPSARFNIALYKIEASKESTLTKVEADCVAKLRKDDFFDVISTNLGK